MDLVAGPMASLLPKLGKLLKPGQALQASMKKDFKLLERLLSKMQASLRKVSEAQQDQLDPQDKQWASEVRELSYDIEDVVDDLLLRKDGGFGPITDTNQDGCGELEETIQDIMERVKELATWKVGDFVAPTRATDVVPRILALYNKELVGIDDPRDHLAERLMDTDGGVPKQQLKIISIFGHGGLGKTTLAKAVYDKLHAKFDLNAFVAVGRNPDMKKVLGDILLKLDQEKYADIHNRRWNEDNLIDELLRVIKYKRYVHGPPYLMIHSQWQAFLRRIFY